LIKITDLEYTVEEYLTACDMKNLSKKTIKSYDQSLKLFAKYVQDNCKINNINQLKKTVIEEYVSFTKEKGKYSFVSNNKSIDTNLPQNRKDYNKRVSAATVNNYLRNIKAFLSWCEEERIIKENVATKIKYLKVTRKCKDQLSDLEYKSLISILDTTKFVEFRDYCIINLIFETGMRLGETLLLKTGDIDLMKKTIILSAENTKSKKGRLVFFGVKMSQLLRRWIQYKDRYMETEILFPTNRKGFLQVINFEKNFRKYVLNCGINKAVTPHGLRNNFGRRFLMSGGDIYTLSRILGHSSVTITEQAYLDLNDEDIRKNYQRFSPLANLDRRGNK
jgi:integrase/recombinase XerD